MRKLPAIVFLLLPLLLAARSEPPQTAPPESTPPRNFTIYGSGLSITPGDKLSYLKFTGGIRCVTQGMELSADVLELELETSKITRGSELRLPKAEVEGGSVVEDPGSVVRSMAAEMEVPSADFNAGAIRRVGAAGNVRIRASGLTMATGELVSVDGGKSWSASGRSTIRRSADDGSFYEISADFILYDMETQRALARGSIDGSYSSTGQEPVQIRAGRVELDIENSVITASENLIVNYRGYQLCCGTLDANIGGKLIRAGDSPELEHPEQGLRATAANITFDLESMVLSATGGITLTDSRRGIELTAGELTARLEQNMLEATGDPLLTKGSSTFTGDRITVFEEDGKTVIEVDGPQRARLNLDELQETGPDAAPGQDQDPPDDAAPEAPTADGG